MGTLGCPSSHPQQPVPSTSYE
ncbi:rCG59851 [Rattus norvegicus]|uniref:RCG59851 n=1 Tax=Rattus norvegicus TaxID=10116 RepID=A6HS19_RAT|nr:rCG59851 [Rattus norvegicus]